MIEPSYISQTAEKLAPGAEVAKWRDERAAEARAQGCQLFRISYHPNPNEDGAFIYLVEGWKETPAEVEAAGGQGEPRFAFQKL